MPPPSEAFASVDSDNSIFFPRLSDLLHSIEDQISDISGRESSAIANCLDADLQLVGNPNITEVAIICSNKKFLRGFKVSCLTGYLSIDLRLTRKDAPLTDDSQ